MRRALTVGGVLAAAIAVTLARRDVGIVDGATDGAYYWRMSEGETVLAPFGYRPLVPTLVRALPIGGHLAFALQTAAFLSASVLVARRWLHAKGVRAWVCVGLLTATAATWAATGNPYLTDAAMLACVACCALFADRGRWVAFAVAAAVAVTARDAAAVVALVPFVAALQGRDRRLLLAAAVPVAVFVACRSLPVVPRPLQSPSEILAWRSAHDGGLPAAVALAAARSFGAGWLLVALHWRRLSPADRRWAAPAAVTTVSLLVAGDWARLLAPAFPLVLAAATRSPLPTWRLAVIAATVLAANVGQSTALALLSFAVGLAVCATSGGDAAQHVDRNLHVGSAPLVGGRRGVERRVPQVQHP